MSTSILFEFFGEGHRLIKCGGVAEMNEAGNFPFYCDTVDTDELGVRWTVIDVEEGFVENAVEGKQVVVLFEGVKFFDGAEGFGFIGETVCETCCCVFEGGCWV